MTYILLLVFLALTGAAVKYIYDELGKKKFSTGFLAVAAVIAAGDLLCGIYMITVSPAVSSHILLIYYLVHAWLLPAVTVMILSTVNYILKKKKAEATAVPAFITAVLQSVIAISGYVKPDVFGFTDRVMRVKHWVVATEPGNPAFLMHYGVYNVLFYINALYALYVLGRLFGRCPKIFRSRYVTFLSIVLCVAVMEVFTDVLQLPVWIESMLGNILLPVVYFLTGDYASRRIRDWSLDNFADNMSDGLILYDMNDRLLHINAMIRRSIHAELSRDFADRSKLDEWLSHTIEMDNAQILKYEGPDRDYYFKPNVQELTDNDIRIGTLYILHDHSDSYNRIRSMRKANEELERAGRMKSDFLANMSHEIRTPMNAVIGMAEIAIREDDPERVNDYLRQIQNSGKNLLNIINDILDYSKIESGKMEIIEDAYSPFEELSDIANVLYVRVGEKPVELFALIEGELPHGLVGDAMRIRQVLINLANNAIKFTNEGSVRICLTCERINEDHVELTYHVIDTGIGIKDEDKSKLFDSFQQLDSKRNRSVEGTGLGLAISKKLVGAMGGRMGLESEYGVGSDFWFTIPQKIEDDSNDIRVGNADSKYAFILTETPERSVELLKGLENLGVAGRIISGLNEYESTGLTEFMFIETGSCNDGMHLFLKAHPDIRCVILAEPTDDTDDDIPNLHTIRKPRTTMNIVCAMNERYDAHDSGDRNLFRVDFSAPDARVLVVDDNDINLTIADGLLAPMNISPDHAHGGREAVEKTITGQYDIVFMDHMMPDVDGVEATIAIRKELNSMVHPVIIALSANVMEEARKLFKSSGMNDFVAKPIDIKDLTEKVKKWLPEEKIIPKKTGDPYENEADAKESECVASHISYSGLDTASALGALGSPALYDKILEEYYRSGNEKYEGIAQAYADGDWADYTIRVHALKSSSRQIGAMALGDMAEELEKAGKASDIDTIRNKTEDTLGEYRSFLDALEEYYGGSAKADDETDKPLIDNYTLKIILTDLRQACEDLDMDAMGSVSGRLGEFAYDEEVKPVIVELRKNISTMDTDKCEELIEQLYSIG
ncbi:MAG: response regulator [Lachnospiraceae bacterium]|nr:response regulator [Lachnospiraceae bacterium]